MSIISEYFLLYDKYKLSYGETFCLFYQIGSFYEAYQLQDKGNVSKIADICRLVITKKNKNIQEISIKNPQMCGIPVDQLQKFIQILINRGYTVIVYSQKPISEPNAKIERILTGIYSAGTVISENKTDNWLVCINIEDNSNSISNLNPYIISISAIDVNIGKSFVTYFTDNSVDELNKLLLKYNPSEILLYNSTKKSKNDILSLCVIDNVKYFDNINNNYSKISYQNEFFSKIFSIDLKSLSFIEYLDLEKFPNLSLVFILLCNYIYNHNKLLLKDINKPDIHLINENNMELYGDIELLDIFNNDNISLFNIINFTSTKFGERELKHRLLHPITTIFELNKRYDNISKISSFKNDLKPLLEKLTDIEKLHRKLVLGILKPQEFYTLNSNYQIIKNIFKLLSDNKYISNYQCDVIDEFIIEDEENPFSLFNEFIFDYTSVFNIDNLINDSISYFKKGINDELNSYENIMKEKMEFILKQMDLLSKLIDPKKECLKLNMSEDNIYFSCTLSRSKKINKKDFPYDLHFANLKNVCKITFDELQQYSEDYYIAKKDFDKKIKELFNAYCQMWSKKYSQLFSFLINTISDIDVSISNCLCAEKYSYFRPNLSENNFLQIKDMRHPIVEYINVDRKFIANDCILKNGMIIFGLNSTGKSIYLKSLGLCVLMAQAGMYVPCKEMTFKPFKKLMSKILNKDNLFTGKSTFILELENIRNFMNKADDNTLILSDELSSGTENYSAISIVSSCINEFYKKGCKFVFSSHFHDIINYVNKDIIIKHFKVEIKNNNIILNRKLEDGPSEKLYGLEIASVLGLDKNIIEESYKIRNKLLNKSEDLISTKTSRYNKDLFVDSCIICNEKNNLHTHHILEQHTADSNGKIGIYHKNIKNNLVVLCENCHQLTHKGKLIIYGYIDTINGIEFKYEKL